MAMVMVFVLNETTKKLELSGAFRSIEKQNNFVDLAKNDKPKANSKFYQSGMQVLSPPNSVINMPLFATAYTVVTGFVQSKIVVAAETVSKTPISDALWPIVDILRDMALPVGIGVAIYGLIEYMLDNPNGKNRIKNAFLGYIGVFIIPIIFRAIQTAFTGQ